MKTNEIKKLKYEFEEVKDFLIALGDEKRQIIIIALLNDHACQGLRVVDLTEATELSRLRCITSSKNTEANWND